VANFTAFLCLGDFLPGDVFRTGVTNDIGLSVGDWCGVLSFVDLGIDKILVKNIA
jgi:uncharacterized membrane protein YczE